MNRNTNRRRSNRRNTRRGGSEKYQERRDAREQAPEEKKNLSDYVGSHNDVSWYTKNEQLISDASKIPFALQLGRPVNFDQARQFSFTKNGHKYNRIDTFTTPGIMALDMICIPGIAKDAADGVNIATSLTFQKIRKELSTYASYAPAEIMMYIAGIDSIFAQYANLVRLFGIANLYSATNLYTPFGLAYAGYGMISTRFQAFIDDINVYRTKFNNLVYKASTLYLPVDFSIISRHSWLFSNYFVDNVSPKAQIYIHRMKGYHVLDETTSTNGTCLMYNDFGTCGITDYLDAFNACIEAYRNSDAMLKIASDMRRAFGDASYWKLAYVDENYMCGPAYDQDVLDQIHNLSVYPSPTYEALKTAYSSVAEGGFNIYQDVNHNTVIFDPVRNITSSGMTEAENKEIYSWNYIRTTQMLDYNRADVGTKEVIEGTRNILIGEGVLANGIYSLSLLTAGADMCVGFSIYYRIPATGGGYTFFHWDFAGNIIGLGIAPSGFEAQSRQISDISMFNWAPRIWFTFDSVDSGGNTVTDLRPLFQLDNYTTVEPQVLVNMNNNILCSMWSVPALG